MTEDYKNIQEHIEQLTEVEYMVEKLNDEEKKKTVSILTGNNRMVKKQCTMCGQPGNNFKIMSDVLSS